LSRSLAFWGVRGLPPAHSPEVISMAMAGIASEQQEKPENMIKKKELDF